MLQYKDVLKYYGDFHETWAIHCLCVAKLSQLIASTINGCDSEFAYWYGLVHDIGRSTERAHKDPRFHCVDGYIILDEMGFDDLKWAPLSHSFPDLNNLSLVPGYYNPLWDPDVENKESIAIKGIWDTFIPEHLKLHEANIYDTIICIADLMSTGKNIVTIDTRLAYARERYGASPKEKETKIAIYKKVQELEALSNQKLNKIAGLEDIE